MSKAEGKVIEWISKNINLLFMAAVTLIAVYIRVDARRFMSSDSCNCLIPWFYEIRNNGGLKGLGTQVGNYNLLYQTVIAFLTYLPVGNDDYYVLYLYKIVSCIFDFCLSLSAARLVCDLRGGKWFDSLFCTVYAVVLFLPTVVMNSAFWAQCDAIYVTFEILSLLHLYREKFLRAFLLLGVAFAFKFQTIFLLPFFVAYYFYKKKFSFLLFGVSAVAFWCSGLLAYINGRSLLEPFALYATQADTYEEMYMNICSFWMLFANDYPRFKNLAVITALILCGLGLYMVITGRKKIDTPVQFLNTAAWFVWSCVFFLPAMHDRYAYLQDILLILLAFLDRKYVKYAVVSAVMSFMAYPAYLTYLNELEELDSLILFFAWAHFTYTVFKAEENVYQISTDNMDRA